MAFRDHPVFADDGAEERPDAVIIGFADRVVRDRPRTDVAAVLPVADISLQRTAARLAKLDAGDWAVVQHPDMGPDHLVIGLGGAYAVTTTRLVGKVLVAGDVMLHNGHCTDYLSRVRSEAALVSVRLGLRVRALLVVDSEELAVREEPHDVGITSSHRLRNWLERQPRVLDRGAVFRRATEARRPRTWR